MKRKNPYINPVKEKHDLTLIHLSGMELECYKILNSGEHLLYVWDAGNRHYNCIGDFFRYSWGVVELREDLLPTLKMVMDRNEGEEVLIGNIISALVEPRTTYFMSCNDMTLGKRKSLQSSKMYIETIIFFEISKAWMNYLESCGGDS